MRAHQTTVGQVHIAGRVLVADAVLFRPCIKVAASEHQRRSCALGRFPDHDQGAFDLASGNAGNSGFDDAGLLPRDLGDPFSAENTRAGDVLRLVFTGIEPRVNLRYCYVHLIGSSVLEIRETGAFVFD
jgi:hypothetical protein